MATSVRMRYLMLVDLACILVAIVMAFVIRYEALINIRPFLARNWTIFVVAPLVYLPVYYAFRLYYRLWRYASTKELMMITGASIAGTALLAVVNFGLLPLLDIPHMPSRSVWLLVGIFSWAFLGATRFLLRFTAYRCVCGHAKPRADCRRGRRRGHDPARNDEQPSPCLQGCGFGG
jgi:FlaA1/EpsC-like NDP-sugar epimerase